MGLPPFRSFLTCPGGGLVVRRHYAGKGCGRSPFQRNVKRVHRLSLRSFVMDQAGRVVIFGPACRSRVRRAAAGFVAQRPHDDRRVVAVADDHPAYAFEKRRNPLRIVREQAAFAVRFDVGFIDDIKAVTVAEFVEIGSLG